MNRPFLRSITTNPETGQRAVDRYLADDYLLRAKTYERMSGGARTWPVRLTRCGEHPGYLGEFDQTDLLSANTRCLSELQAMDRRVSE